MMFVKQLKEAQEAASLSVADMAAWFSVTRSTMNTWLNGVTPQSFKLKQLEYSLEILKMVLRDTKRGQFPIPLSVDQYERRAYINRVRDHAVREFSKSDTTARRHEMLGINQEQSS